MLYFGVKIIYNGVCILLIFIVYECFGLVYCVILLFIIVFLFSLLMCMRCF